MNLKPYYAVENGFYKDFDRKKYNSDQEFVDSLSRNDPYQKPVTTISYEQAKYYCIWYTRSVNARLNKHKKYSKKVIQFRLPTQNEFETIGMNGIARTAKKLKTQDSLKTATEMLACKNDKGCALCNHYGKGDCENNKMAERLFGKETYPVASYFCDDYGIYDLQGNVAEMIVEEHKAMGGSYKDKAEDCRPGSIKYYDGPQPWLGIRLWGEVLKVDGKNILFDRIDNLVIRTGN